MSGWKSLVARHPLLFTGFCASWLPGCSGTRTQAASPAPTDSHAGGGPAATLTSPSHVVVSSEVLGSLGSSGPSGATIALIRRDCGELDCALSVATHGRSELPQLTLGWRVPVGPVNPADDGTNGEFFVRAPFASRRAWTIGEEESTATISLAALSAPAAFLLQAEMGFEHVKRSHAIVALTSECWVQLWSRDDLQGPHWTAVASSGNDAQLVYLDAFLHPDANAPDELEGTVLAFMGPAVPLREQSLAEAGVAVLVLPLASFSGPAAAKAARAQPCLGATLALPTARFAKAAPGSVSLIKVGLDTALLAAEATRMAECLGKPTANIRRLAEPTTSKE